MSAELVGGQRREGATVAVAAFKPFERLLEAVGLDPEAYRRQRLRSLLRAYGLDEAALAHEDARIPTDLAVETLEQLAATLGTEAIALHAVQSWRLGDHGAGDYLNASCANLRQYFATAREFVPLLHDGIRFAVVEEGERTLLVCERDDDVGAHPWLAESVIGKLAVEARRALGPEAASLAAMKVRFAHRPPAYEPAYRKALGAEVDFDQGCDALVVSSRALDVRFRTADPVLHTILSRNAAERLRGLPARQSFVARVREVIEAELQPSSAAQAVVAERLGVSVATLRRRLEQRHAVRYCDLVVDAQRRVAAAQLRDSRLRVEDVGARVGFGEKAAFHRAFKRWFGCTPAVYRRSLRRR